MRKHLSLLEKVSGTLLFLYLVVYFLVPYRPWSISQSFHTPILLLGIPLIAVEAALRVREGRRAVPTDLRILALFVAFFSASALGVHLHEFSLGGFLSYIFGVLCFLFVRAAIVHVDRAWLYKGVTAYLMVSGLLIVLQIRYGGFFYVCALLGQGGFGETSPGWGFSNFHVVGGGIMAWFLAIALARYSFGVRPGRSTAYHVKQLFAIGIGFVGMFYTTSRAAWLGTLVVVAGIGGTILVKKLPWSRFRHAVLSMALFMTILKCFVLTDVYRVETKSNFFASLFFRPDYAMQTDVSANTKLKAWGLALETIRNAPVWGLGIDKFPALFEARFPRGTGETMDEDRKVNASSTYLAFMVELGGLPALMFFALIAYALFRGWSAGTDSDVFPFLVGLVAILVWAMPAEYQKERTFWIALGTVMGLAGARSLESAPAEERL